MVIKGSGGEGKSQIGTVLSHLFGPNAKDGSVGKVSENRFARADLEHIHLLIDDDMRMEALRQTNYVKSLVTAQGRMDLETGLYTCTYVRSGFAYLQEQERNTEPLCTHHRSTLYWRNHGFAQKNA